MALARYVRPYGTYRTHSTCARRVRVYVYVHTVGSRDRGAGLYARACVNEAYYIKVRDRIAKRWTRIYSSLFRDHASLRCTSQPTLCRSSRTSCTMSESGAGAEAQPLKKYSWEEVRQHQSRSSLWVVVHNKVYDVTEFMDEVGPAAR